MKSIKTRATKDQRELVKALVKRAGWDSYIDRDVCWWYIEEDDFGYSFYEHSLSEMETVSMEKFIDTLKKLAERFESATKFYFKGYKCRVFDDCVEVGCQTWTYKDVDKMEAIIGPPMASSVSLSGRRVMRPAFVMNMEDEEEIWPIKDLKNLIAKIRTAQKK
jgi:hypothetical protein